MPPQDIYFSETQRFNQWWIALILIGINGIFLFGVYWQVVAGHTFGDNPMSDTGILISSGVLLLLTAGFYAMRMDTVVDRDGIAVRFIPFHQRYKRLAWSDLAKAEIRTYNAFGEFGGWGLRLGGRKAGNAYCVRGNQGLQLEFKNGKRLLIGTQKPALLHTAVHKAQEQNT